MSLKSIFLTSLIILGVIYWLRARDLKQLALIEASRYCANLQLSLLDESVALKGLKLLPTGKGRRQLCRCYQFDFTVNGQDRYQGEIILSGRRVLKVNLPPHRID